MSKLCSNAANCGIKKIQNALPESLKTKVLQSINISTYVFVIKNKEQAKKLLKFLEEKGFSNISIDSKGTTITAQSSSGIINASNDTGTLGCKASVKGGACGNYIASQATCSKHYISKTNFGNRSCIQCKWFGTGSQPCRDGGCQTCPTN